MITIDNLLQVAAQIESERGVPKEILFEAIQEGVLAATKKRYPDHEFICS